MKRFSRDPVTEAHSHQQHSYLVNCKCNEWKCTQIALNYMKVQNMQMTNNFITVLLKTQITFNYQSEMAHEVPRCVQVRPVLKTKYLY